MINILFLKLFISSLWQVKEMKSNFSDNL